MLVAAVLLAGIGCDEDVSETTTAEGGMGGGPTSGPTAGPGGTGGSGAGAPYVPTAEDIDFVAVAEVPSGEQLIFNDWSFPDRVLSMQTDGSNAVEIFRAYRVWSLGVARGADRMAFAVGDSEQEAHYGLTIGDSIQHTFIYDFASQTVAVAAYGNINDECHHWGPGDTKIYVCRRYDFMPDNTNQTYRLGAITVADGSFEFLVDEEPTVLTLSPQVTDDGSELYFGRIQINNGVQSRSIGKLALPDGAPEVVRGNAFRPLLKPGGARYLYTDPTNASAIYESDLDGGNVVLVADVAGTDAAYSPDGTRVAFLVNDSGANCSHVHVAASDGSESAAPPRIRDCSTSGEFITALAWIERP